MCMLSACHVRPAIFVTIRAATCAQMNPQFYAFRWITLLLTQEFPFPDAVSVPL